MQSLLGRVGIQHIQETTYTIVQKLEAEGIREVENDLCLVVLAGRCRDVALDATDLGVRAYAFASGRAS